ncbi:adenosylcobinamide-GDP ribazoletransferase [Streptococcus danieliae]|uniref:Adenosylcobinamide-GDP ribazoletransferase n=1 Tax=Streptococcus danieliae TaxID=747656 RepID=A0A7Z0S458_9STRE|nr:adenosylcobinamide-GDP ribazoletransferase [Streptococcus danieliae]MBF0698450.1 adenosylcobinamide-GDP ribazoletransferase [Streptococcus danieliae]MVX58080.1 adenosylcobinamide-GDP ribazoletransferase [Streptococcus danieliae]NYS95627.1 adenosylcobinamide-GDP ribazoletransferase [Streptococcus danieliae]
MIRSLLIYTQFFTRIPVPLTIDLSYIRTGVPFLSLFGLLLGCLWSSLFLLLTSVLPSSLSLVVLLFFDVLLTGGFHMDALADTADGLFSSRKPERMLEIMKDSRMGTNGVLALIFFYLLFVAAFWEQKFIDWQVLLMLATISKAGLAIQVWKLRDARAHTGSGNFFQGAKGHHIVLAQALPIGLSFYFFQNKGLIAYASFLVGALLYRRFVYRKIGGQTGDTLGAYALLGQLCYLLGLVI